jgi:hypothetical protein
VYFVLIGWNFNLLRFHHVKSRGRHDNNWPFDRLDLREVSMVGRQLIGANCVPGPTYEKLDRLLMDTQ